MIQASELNAWKQETGTRIEALRAKAKATADEANKQLQAVLEETP